MPYRLLLEDRPERTMGVISGYMKSNEYFIGDWKIVRNYDEFVDCVRTYGIPELVSFDHDLSKKHYSQLNNINYNDSGEKTGYHAAVWLTDYCQKNGLKFPKYLVHSWNMEGKKNIETYIKNYKKHCESADIVNMSKDREDDISLVKHDGVLWIFIPNIPESATEFFIDTDGYQLKLWYFYNGNSCDRLIGYVDGVDKGMNIPKAKYRHINFLGNISKDGHVASMAIKGGFDLEKHPNPYVLVGDLFDETSITKP